LKPTRATWRWRGRTSENAREAEGGKPAGKVKRRDARTEKQPSQKCKKKKLKASPESTTRKKEHWGGLIGRSEPGERAKGPREN